MLDSDYCISHDQTRKTQLRESRAKGVRHAAKLRVLVGRRRKLSTAAEVAGYLSAIVQGTVEARLEPTIARTAIYGLATLRAVLESSDLEQRLKALEAAEKHQDKEAH